MNPLTAERAPIAFPAVQAEHVEPAVAEAARTLQSALEALASAPPRYDAVLEALERASAPLERVGGLIGHLESVLAWPEFREAYNQAQPTLAALYSRTSTDAGLFRALSELRAAPEFAELGALERRHTQLTWEGLQRSGAALDADGKAQLSALDVELSELTTRFSQNVVDATAAFELIVDAARVHGLPDSARAAAAASAEAHGHAGQFRFTLDAPSYVAALTYLDDAELRRTLHLAHGTRAAGAPHHNEQLIERILTLRQQKAKLLGFTNFADLALADRMAGRGTRAVEFLDSLRAAATAQFAREKLELQAFRQELEGDDAAPLQAWDTSYYAEKMRKARYDFDDEALRPYFSLERVLEGLFSLLERLFDVHITKVQDAPTWHADVRVYRARTSARELGLLYLDLHPRPGKRDGAWMHGLLDAPSGDSPAAHGFAAEGAGLVVANLTQPDAQGRCLLLHREVVTLFHEFGHLMHHMLSDVPVRDLAGTRVAWDFVELPSQILENWCWEQESLQSFAVHVDTGAPIPTALVETLRRARSFRAATALMRQIGFSTVDLSLHTDYEPGRDGDVLSHCRRLLAAHSATELPEEHAMIASFLHLFSSPVGYAAGYYSYQWAEALEADAFARFRDEGLFSAAVGQAFVAHVLSRGNSQPPSELFAAFRGREVDPQAMLRRIGL